MSTVRSSPLPNGKYQASYKNAQGERVWITGTRDRRETRQIANKIEDDHHQVALGYRDPAKPWEKTKARSFRVAADEYLAWGEAQGGIRGHPWGAHHLRQRTFYLKFWEKTLDLKTLGDLYGKLPDVEQVLRDMPPRKLPGDASPPEFEPIKGKTLNNYADGLGAFCQWLVERKQLGENPLTGFKKFDNTPSWERRALTLLEITRLFDALKNGPIYGQRRALGYELAIVSGLRRGELMALQVEDLDMVKGGLRLDGAWTKNRKPGFQVLPDDLLARLEQSAKGKPRTAKLVFISRRAAESLILDFDRAGIPKELDGSADFHGFRVTFATLLDQAGATAKEQQVMMRHATGTNLTFERYSKSSHPRLRELVERVGRIIHPAECVAGVYAVAMGGASDPITTDTNSTSKIKNERSVRDSNRTPSASTHIRQPIVPHTATPRLIGGTALSNAPGRSVQPADERQHIAPYTSKQREKCVAGVYSADLHLSTLPPDPDLAFLTERWARLPPDIRAAIKSIATLHASGGTP
jgi:integrase